MEELMNQVTVKVNDKLFLKNPESSDLGKAIVAVGLDMIHEVGFEQFTFKKLADKINSTESTLYRYFENKHKLLLYLLNWYWCWLEYKLVFSTANIHSAGERLKIAIATVLLPEQKRVLPLGIDAEKLYEVVISESPKAYLTKEVDQENKEGFFAVYKRLCKRIADIVHEINPNYRYANSLVSTAIEGAHLQHYFRSHLPSLTNFQDSAEAIVDFYTQMVTASIRSENI